MIYTVTFNPAIDYCMKIQDLNLGKTNRSYDEQIYFGGKGINVSLVLKQLDTPSVCLGFIAGFTGNALESHLKEKGIKTDFINLKNGNTRINVKLKGKTETEINADGPDIDSNSLEILFEKIEHLKDGDTLVLAGSIPKSLPDDIYEKILEKVADKQIRIVIDATNNLLLNTLKYKPFLIKPNIDELQEIFSKEFSSEEEIIECAKELQQKGAQNIIVSLAEKGAILVDCLGNVHKQEAIGGRAVNSVGAGDSMIAGFLSGIDKGFNYALKLGSCAAGATAVNENLATKQEILDLMQKMADTF